MISKNKLKPDVTHLMQQINELFQDPFRHKQDHHISTAIKRFKLLLVHQKPIETNRDQQTAVETSRDQYGLTLAGIGVASLSWSPRQVVVEVLTLFTVQTFGVVVTHAVTVNLKTQKTQTHTYILKKHSI